MKPKKKIEPVEEDENKKDFEEFKKKQLLFQKDDNVPIHLKGGKRDKFFYYTTLTLAGFGLLNCVAFIYYSSLSEKDKKDIDDFWNLKRII